MDQEKTAKAGDKSQGNVKNESQKPKEIGGSGKAEPTRYGDWEVDGRCSDF